MTTEDELAGKIGDLRSAKGFSYRTLAAAMTEHGVDIDASSLQKIEKGTPRRKITVNELVGFAAVFGVTAAALIGEATGDATSGATRIKLMQISRDLLALAAADG